MFYRLESVMGGRPSVEPLALNSRDGNDADRGAALNQTQKASGKAGGKGKRSSDDAYNESFLELRAGQIKNERRFQEETVGFKKSKIEIEQKKLDLMADRARYDLSESRARTEEAQAKAAKLRQETNMGALQEKIVLLRERQKPRRRCSSG